MTSIVAIRSSLSRSALTALGIGIGIAALVAVGGITASSRAALLLEIDRLGTDLLAVQAAPDVLGRSTALPEDAPARITHLPPVRAASSVATVHTTVRRSHVVPANRTSGITVMATDTNLAATLSGDLHQGRFLDTARAQVPTAVLGAVAARRLGIESLHPAARVYLDGHWFDISGILAPLPLAPDLDRAVLIGHPIAQDLFDTDPGPSTIYLRTHPDTVEAVRGVLARTAKPQAPNEVTVSRPSDALAARASVDTGLTRLLVALSAVALIVGAVGVANVMVISVVERRSEIGVRRALGAQRRHIAAQFLLESTLLTVAGSIAGVVMGILVTATYAHYQGQPPSVPAVLVPASVGVSIAIGLIAGVHPARRAARLDPAIVVHSSV